MLRTGLLLASVLGGVVADECDEIPQSSRSECPLGERYTCSVTCDFYGGCSAQQKCYPCDSNSYSDVLNATQCTQCPWGRFYNARGDSTGSARYIGATHLDNCTSCAINIASWSNWQTMSQEMCDGPCKLGPCGTFPMIFCGPEPLYSSDDPVWSLCTINRTAWEDKCAPNVPNRTDYLCTDWFPATPTTEAPTTECNNGVVTGWDDWECDTYHHNCVFTCALNCDSTVPGEPKGTWTFCEGTQVPTAAAPTTAEPTTAAPTTATPTTAEPTTATPTTAEPTTAEPTTAEPTTAEPTTAEPTTAEPTTGEPTSSSVDPDPEPDFEESDSDDSNAAPFVLMLGTLSVIAGVVIVSCGCIRGRSRGGILKKDARHVPLGFGKAWNTGPEDKEEFGTGHELRPY